MKIQIIENEDKAKTSTIKDDFLPITLDGLAKIENASCTDIRVGQILDLASKRELLLDSIITKLRYGGSIFIEGLDLIALTDAITFGQFNNVEASQLIYGDNRRSISDFINMVNTLKNKGLNITIKRLDGIFFFVEAERQKPNGIKN